MFRMNKHVFLHLCDTLQNKYNLRPTRNVGIHEQVALFLYMLGQPASVRNLEERFQTLHLQKQTRVRCLWGSPGFHRGQGAPQWPAAKERVGDENRALFVHRSKTLTNHSLKKRRSPST